MNKHALTYIAGVIFIAAMLLTLTLFQHYKVIANKPVDHRGIALAARNGQPIGQGAV